MSPVWPLGTISSPSRAMSAAPCAALTSSTLVAGIASSIASTKWQYALSCRHHGNFAIVHVPNCRRQCNEDVILGRAIRSFHDVINTKVTKELAGGFRYSLKTGP